MRKTAAPTILVALVLLAIWGIAESQQPVKVWKMGIFTSSSSPVTSLRLEGLRQGLREFGYVEGKNIIIEQRNAETKPDRYPEIAAELVRLRADVIVVTHIHILLRV
jgi:putative tryptophan/tyrosine transport system substrate-binding protein